MPTRRARPLAALAALLAAAAIAWMAFADARDRDALLARAVENGLRGAPLAEVQAAIRRERDPAERRLALARALFAARPGDSRADGPETRVRQLETAETLAIEALADLPASWEASSLVGAARFESRRLRRDTRLFSAATDWERPLFAAVARASGSPIVERQLATAYIEVWPAMAPERRDQAAELLRRMFRDRRFLVASLERWVQVNGSIDRAAELLPEDAETAKRLFTLALKRGGGSNAVRWSAEHRLRLRREIAAGIAAADGGAEPWRSNHLSLLVEQAPVGIDFAPLVERALAGTSPEGRGLGFADAAARWLLWAEPLCLVRACPLGPPTVAALLTSAAARLGTPSAAFATLAAGKPVSAEQLARRAKGLKSEDWTAYTLLLAQRHLAAGDAAAARAALADVSRKARRWPTYARLAELAGVAHEASSADGDPLARQAWDSADWRRDASELELELGAARAAGGVRLAFRRPAWRPFLLETELDGEVGPTLWITRGAETVEIPLPLEPGIHLLRLRADERDLPTVVRIELD